MPYVVVRESHYLTVEGLPSALEGQLVEKLGWRPREQTSHSVVFQRYPLVLLLNQLEAMGYLVIASACAADSYGNITEVIWTLHRKEDPALQQPQGFQYSS